jgi:hypothetical protein
MILVAYRHGLRASEVCDLQWQQIELSKGLHVHRVKSGIPSAHPIRSDEMRALRKLRRDSLKTPTYSFPSAASVRDNVRRRQCDSFSSALDHLGILAGAGREHVLNRLYRGLDLFVRHRLNPSGMLDFHLARHQKRKDFEVRGRLVTSDLFNRLLALMAEVQQQRLHELLVQQMTRAVPVPMRISRNPLLEGHLALHVHRVVLNVNKCLMGFKMQFPI